MSVPAFYDSITQFIFVQDPPQKADVIFVPGGHTGAHALTAAKLYREGFAPYVLPSGKYSKQIGHYEGPKKERFATEWDFLRNVLIEAGVPEDAILKEDKATYTWENAVFSARLLQKLKKPVQRAILCCQAHHARRALMYYQAEFPETQIITVPTVTGEINADNWYLDPEKTKTVLGELERIGSQFRCMLPLGDPLGFSL